MRRAARIVTTTALAAGLAAAVSAATPAAAAPGSQPGWNYIATYPSKGECVNAGQAGVPQQWDEFRCQPRVEPVAATSASASASSDWDLWAVVYVG